MFYVRYTNSFLATFVSFLGSTAILGGILMAVAGLIGPGVIIAAVGALLMFAAKKISESKANHGK